MNLLATILIKPLKIKLLEHQNLVISVISVKDLYFFVTENAKLLEKEAIL